MKKYICLVILCLVLILSGHPSEASPKLGHVSINVYNWDGALETLNKAINLSGKNSLAGKRSSFALGSVNDKSIAIIDIHNFSENSASLYLDIALKINSSQIVNERRKEMLTNLNYIQPHYVISETGIVLRVR